LLFCACLSAFGQGGRGGATQTTSPLPDNPQSLAHIDAARKIANDDPVLMTPLNFFCSPVDYTKPGPELEPMKVFDNLYAIPVHPSSKRPSGPFPHATASKAEPKRLFQNCRK